MTDSLAKTAEFLTRVRTAVATVIVGQETVVDEVLLCLLAGGHCLLEGVPGLGKTLLVRSFAAAMGLQFSRLQFTPDLMPADVTGTQIVNEDEHGRRRFELVKGPIFGQLVLADEINRATPKTQSALLEAMQEHQVTIAGERHLLPQPFTVLATENPIEMEGTYPLPEAQLDRFLLKVLVPRPDTATMVSILTRTTGDAQPLPEAVASPDELTKARALCRSIAIAGPLVEWIAKALRLLDPQAPEASERTRNALRVGPGVRGGQAIVLAAKASALLRGSAHVGYEDLSRVLCPALRHRMILSFDGESEGIGPDALIRELVPDPAQQDTKAPFGSRAGRPS